MNSYTPIRILILLNGSLDGDQIRTHLNDHAEKYTLRFAISQESFLEKLDSFVPQLCLLDCQAAGKGIGKFIQQIHQQAPENKIIVIAEPVDEGPILEAVRAGVDHFLFKHHLDQLPAILQKCLDLSRSIQVTPVNYQSLELLNSARFHLLTYATHHSLDELLQESLDQICQLTDSEVGFFHFIESDQRTISLQTWSTKTMQTYCKADGKGSHYDVDEAGVWADCIRERKPVIHNEYASLTNKRGLPQGHSPVVRELVVPVFRNELIVAVLGVGNKSMDYDGEDLKIVSYFTDLVWDIADRKKVEEQLKASEQRFRSFVENANDTVFTLDREGRFQYISSNWEEVFGGLPEKALGKPYQEYVHPDDIAYCSEFLQKVFNEGGKHSGLEYRIISKNGLWRWHTTSASLLIDDAGGEPTLLGISHDISDRIESEQKLVESEASIRKRLLAITTPDGDVDTLELADLIDWDALNSMLDDFCELTPYVIGIVDLNGKVLVAKGWQEICTKFHRCNPETLKNCMMSDSELSQNVMPGTFKFYKCKNNMWDISTPLMLNNRHVGNIFLGQFFFEDEILDVEVFRKQAKRYGFEEKAYLEALNKVPRLSPETVATVMNFYTKLSSLISSLSYSNIQLAHILTEKNRLLDDLQVSEARYYHLVESLPTPIFLARQGIYTYSNPAGLRNLGYGSLEEFIGKHVTETIHPDSIPVLQERIQGLKNGQPNQTVELKILQKNGKVRIAESTSVPALLHGEMSTLILNHDITDRKEAEEKLQSANMRLQALWSVAALQDTDDPKIISNHILETVTRMTSSDYGFYGFIDDAESMMTIHSWSGAAMKECEIQNKPQLFPIEKAGIWGEAIRDHQAIIINDYLRDQPGKKGLPEGHIPIRNLLVVPFFCDGKIVSVAAVANSPSGYDEDDISQINTFLINVQSIVDRTKAENARRKIESLHNEAEQLTHAGAWEWKVDEKTLFWSDQVYRIHGLTPEEYPNESAELKTFSLNCYHPEDRAIIEEAFEACVQHGTSYAIEARFKPLHGDLMWVRTIGKPVVEHGKVVRVTGYIMDIHARKEAQLELQKQQELLEISQKTAHLGSYEFDLVANSNKWTDEVFRIFGLDDQMGVPSNAAYRIFIIEDDVEKVQQAYTNSLETGEKMDLVYRIRRRDGELRYIHNLGEPQYDSLGNVIRFFGTFQDVTESKILELALQKSLVEKEVLLREVHHRVKNNLAAILGLIEMERYNSPDEKMQNLFGELGGRIKSIATVHETLYKSDDLSKIRFQEYLEALIQNLVTSLQSDQAIQTIIDARDVEMDLQLAVPCGLIINELITNALKHAFPAAVLATLEDQQADIKITVKQYGHDYCLSVADNGIGFPADLDLHSANTLGLKLITMLGEHQLGGKLELIRDQGTRIKLTFSQMLRE